MTGNKKSVISLLLTIISCLYGFTDEPKTQYTSLFITGYIETSESIKADRDLNFISFGGKSFRTTEWGLRTGGGISLLISTSELAQGQNSPVYGGLFAGFFLGEELQIWQVTFSINLILGAGVSISNIWISPWHMDYFGEINVDAGIIMQENFSITVFAGFQSIGNLFPQFPGTAYIMYYPVWGIAFTW